MKTRMKQADIKVKCTGAGGDDIFDGTSMAVEALGEGAKGGNSGLLAFAYLYRRFGPPFCGSDDHKDICGYQLTTDDPKVFLRIYPKASGLEYSVGYLAAEELHKERMEPLIEWGEKFENWWVARWQKDHQEDDFEKFLEWPKEKQEELQDLYWSERYKKEVMDLAKIDIGEFPNLHSSKHWREEEKNSVKYRVNIALFNALKELLRPVYVRDVPINILGRCEPETKLGFRKPANHSKYAGFGVPKKAMDDWIKDD